MGYHIASENYFLENNTKDLCAFLTNRKHDALTMLS
jgi:hypothetical protein